MTGAEIKSDFKLTTGTPYLVLMGKLCNVYFEDFEENWACYNGTALYAVFLYSADGKINLVSKCGVTKSATKNFKPI